MLGKYVRFGLLISSGIGLSTQSNIFQENVYAITPQKKEKKQIILQPFNEDSNPELNKPTLDLNSDKKNPRTFFEIYGLETLKKVAIFHLVGFIGYIPHVSGIVNNFIGPLIPLNMIIDGGLGYTFTKNLNDLEISNKKIDSKEIIQVADYTSWLFAFVCSGGKCRALPGFLGMMASVFIYSIYTGDSYKRQEAIITGTIGATLINSFIIFGVPFYLGRMPAYKLFLTTILNYSVLSYMLTGIIEEYVKGNNEEKLSSAMLSCYKWMYLNLFLQDYVIGEK